MLARQALVVMGLALLATGCGVSATPVAAPVRPVSTMAAPQQAGLQIDRATRSDNHPSNPARITLRLVGKDGQKPVEIVVSTLNRSWSFYVPTLDKVVVNGKQVTDPKALTELHERLYKVQGDKEAQWLSQFASQIVRFGVSFGHGQGQAS